MKHCINFSGFLFWEALCKVQGLLRISFYVSNKKKKHTSKMSESDRGRIVVYQECEYRSEISPFVLAGIDSLSC